MQFSYPVYLDKVHGGWIGKCIGGAIGALQENNKSLMDYTMDNVFPDTIPPNDDLDLQILYLQEVLEKKGSGLTSRDLGEAFVVYNLCLANEYSIAIKNMELGIAPPWSGSHNNSYFRHSMGCPIRSEIWAFICPGHPNAAARYAAMDGVIDHEGESVYGEQFFAALEARSFVENDLLKLIEFGLTYVPRDTELYQCIIFVTEQYAGKIGWRLVRERMMQRFGSADASYSIINIGITIMALLYGEGDFTATMLTAVNSGFDTDCTAATAGSILGVILGARGIPDFWLDKIGEIVVIGTVDIKRYSDKIIDLAKDTCSAGLSLARDGVIEVEFTDIPADVKPSLPLPADPASAELSIQYQGVPSIGVGEKRTVTVTAADKTGKGWAGTLTITPPPSLSCSIKQAELSIPAGESVQIPVEFAVADGVDRLPQKNIVWLKMAHSGEAEESTELAFGLSGAARMKLIGPFWDNYDTTVYESDPYQGKMPHTLQAMFNSWVNLDKSYIDESFADIDGLEGRFVNFHEDKLSPHAFIRYRGPSCIYLVHDIECPQEREGVHLLLGNEGPFKFWLNGELILAAKEPAMWMPYNHFVETKLKAGRNRAVIKLISYGKPMDFSFQMRSAASKLHLFTDLTTVW